jgi:hypothetical protein
MRFVVIRVDDIFEVGCTSFYLLNKDLASVLIVRLGALNSRLKPGRFVAVRGLGAVILDRRKRQRLKMDVLNKHRPLRWNLLPTWRVSAMKPNLFFAQQ